MHRQRWSPGVLPQRGTFDVAVGGLGVLANEIDVCKISRQAAVTDLQEIQAEVRSQIRKAWTTGIVILPSAIGVPAGTP